MNDLDGHLPAIAAGDASAFGQFMAAAEAPLRDSLRRFAASVDTEAVLQEALLRLWQVAPQVRPDGRPNALLRLGVTIARNLAISEARRLRHTVVGDDDLERHLARAEEGPSPADPLLRRLIEACRDKLPPKPREALDARLAASGREDDLDLSSRLGVRLNTFLQNVTRARKLLADCLRGQGVEIEAEA